MRLRRVGGSAGSRGVARIRLLVLVLVLLLQQKRRVRVVQRRSRGARRRKRGASSGVWIRGRRKGSGGVVLPRLGLLLLLLLLLRKLQLLLLVIVRCGSGAAVTGVARRQHSTVPVRRRSARLPVRRQRGAVGLLRRPGLSEGVEVAVGVRHRVVPRRRKIGLGAKTSGVGVVTRGRVAAPAPRRNAWSEETIVRVARTLRVLPHRG
jgi:hypothetical protein